MTACKGLIFKLRKSSFWNKDRLVFKQEFYLMKSLSCNNCPKCDYIKEQLKIDINENNDHWISDDEIARNELFEGYLIDDYGASLRPIRGPDSETPNGSKEGVNCSHCSGNHLNFDCPTMANE